jgi:hypothetical protein
MQNAYYRHFLEEKNPLFKPKQNFRIVYCVV